MPRKPRQESTTGLYHWITRGMHRKSLFHFKEDYLYFLSLVKEHSREQGILIHHYCLMPNHVHMLLCASSTKDLSLFSHFVKRRYAYYHSKTSKHQGASFERMYKSIPVEEDSYLLECARYIERNPLRANLVQVLEQYPYSSYAFYAKGDENDLLTSSPSYFILSDNPADRQKLYVEYVNQYRPQEEYAKGDKFGA